MNDCTFCKIVAGRLPSYRVLEDDHTVAFLDIAPANPGHTLVVPRDHARDVWDIPEASHAHVSRMVHRVAALLRATLKPDGINVVHSTGEAAWQDVFHFHVHVVPRWRSDGLRLMWSAEPAPPQELEHTLERLNTFGGA